MNSIPGWGELFQIIEISVGFWVERRKCNGFKIMFIIFSGDNFSCRKSGPIHTNDPFPRYRMWYFTYKSLQLNHVKETWKTINFRLLKNRKIWYVYYIFYTKTQNLTFSPIQEWYKYWKKCLNDFEFFSVIYRRLNFRKVFSNLCLLITQYGLI